MTKFSASEARVDLAPSHLVTLLLVLRNEQIDYHYYYYACRNILLRDYDPSPWYPYPIVPVPLP
jgi:hypothetical protein